jgi:hypothetical protein
VDNIIDPIRSDDPLFSSPFFTLADHNRDLHIKFYLKVVRGDNQACIYAQVHDVIRVGFACIG